MRNDISVRRGQLSAAGETLPAEGATFRAAAIDIDPTKLFNQIDAELSQPVIVDVAVRAPAMELPSSMQPW